MLNVEGERILEREFSKYKGFVVWQVGRLIGIFCGYNLGIEGKLRKWG